MLVGNARASASASSSAPAGGASASGDSALPVVVEVALMREDSQPRRVMTHRTVSVAPQRGLDGALTIQCVPVHLLTHLGAIRPAMRLENLDEYLVHRGHSCSASTCAAVFPYG